MNDLLFSVDDKVCKPWICQVEFHTSLTAQTLGCGPWSPSAVGFKVLLPRTGVGDKNLGKDAESLKISVNLGWKMYSLSFFRRYCPKPETREAEVNPIQSDGPLVRLDSTPKSQSWMWDGSEEKEKAVGR